MKLTKEMFMKLVNQDKERLNMVIENVPSNIFTVEFRKEMFSINLLSWFWRKLGIEENINLLLIEEIKYEQDRTEEFEKVYDYILGDIYKSSDYVKISREDFTEFFEWKDYQYKLYQKYYDYLGDYFPPTEGEGLNDCLFDEIITPYDEEANGEVYHCLGGSKFLDFYYDGWGEWLDDGDFKLYSIDEFYDKEIFEECKED